MRIILSGYTDLSVVTDSVNRGALSSSSPNPGMTICCASKFEMRFDATVQEQAATALGRI